MGVNQTILCPRFGGQASHMTPTVCNRTNNILIYPAGKGAMSHMITGQVWISLAPERGQLIMNKNGTGR